MHSAGWREQQYGIRGESAQPDSSACCCIDQKKLQSGDVRATRKTEIEIEVAELTEGRWEEGCERRKGERNKQKPVRSRQTVMAC